MVTIFYSEARKKLKDLCDKVATENESVIITRRNAANVVIISMDEYNFWINQEKRSILLRTSDQRE